MNFINNRGNDKKMNSGTLFVNYRVILLLNTYDWPVIEWNEMDSLIDHKILQSVYIYESHLCPSKYKYELWFAQFNEFSDFHISIIYNKQL